MSIIYESKIPFKFKKILARILMVFDECTNYPSPKKEAQNLELSKRWAARSKDAHKSQSALFGIVQGGMYEDLREESLNLTLACEFDTL